MPRWCARATATRPSAWRLLLAHREVVERQLAEVASHLRAIDHKIALYEHKVVARRLTGA